MERAGSKNSVSNMDLTSIIPESYLDIGTVHNDAITYCLAGMVEEPDAHKPLAVRLASSRGRSLQHSRCSLRHNRYLRTRSRDPGLRRRAGQTDRPAHSPVGRTADHPRGTSDPVRSRPRAASPSQGSGPGGGGADSAIVSGQKAGISRQWPVISLFGGFQLPWPKGTGNRRLTTDN